MKNTTNPATDFPVNAMVAAALERSAEYQPEPVELDELPASAFADTSDVPMTAVEPEPPHEPSLKGRYPDPDYAAPEENPILAAAAAERDEVNAAAAELRLKGYGVRYYRPEPATPYTLEVTAPYTRYLFEMTLDRLSDAVPVLVAMDFAAPPLFADPNTPDPTPAEADEFRKRAEAFVLRTA